MGKTNANKRNKRVGGLRDLVETLPPDAPPTRLDKEVQAWLNTAATNPGALTAKQRWDRQRVRARIDLDAETKTALEAVTAMSRLDTSMSQLANLLLAYGLREYLRGNPEVQAAIEDGRSLARSPRFAYKLHPPDAWLDEIAAAEPE